jgi:tetratricopeptide (TPR) repeat protein
MRLCSATTTRSIPTQSSVNRNGSKSTTTLASRIRIYDNHASRKQQSSSRANNTNNRGTTSSSQSEFGRRDSHKKTFSDIRTVDNIINNRISSNNNNNVSFVCKAVSMSSMDESKSRDDEDIERLIMNKQKIRGLNRGEGEVSSWSSSSSARKQQFENNNKDNYANANAKIELGKDSAMKTGAYYAAQQTQNDKPLKINQDLLIEEAKRIRNQSLFARTRAERRKLREPSIETFKRAIQYDAKDGRAYVGIGKIYVQQKEYAKAREIYEFGTRATGSENAHLWQAFATLERKAGNIQQARKYFDAATIANPKHAAAWHGWGELERGEGNYQRARDLFLKGLMKVPKSESSAHLYHSLGLMAMERGRFEEARAHFRDGAKTDKGAKSAAIWQSWGLLEAECGENERARQYFKRGLEVCPKSKYIWLAWGRFEASVGNIPRARQLLQRGVSLNPADRSLLQAIARLEANDGNIRMARQYFAAGTKLDPSHQQNWQAWGVAEFRSGNIEKARELFQRGVWVRPESKDAAVGLQAWAILERSQGNIPLARELFKCSVKANPTNQKSWLSWAQMEEEIDNVARASELRNLCAQQRAEEAIGMTDLSPASLVGLDATIRPILKRLSSLLSGESSSGSGDTFTRTDENGDLYETDSFVWAGDELLFSNGKEEDQDDDYSAYDDDYK